jgi:hypothetical protein
VPAVVTLPAPTDPARELSSRDWALIAKSPDSHIGEHVVVFGYVTQFDSVTGPSAFGPASAVSGIAGNNLETGTTSYRLAHARTQRS